MRYVIKLPLQPEKRKELNEMLRCSTTNAFLISGYVAHIAMAGATLSFFLGFMMLGKILVACQACIGLLISIVDAMVSLISLNWEEIEEMEDFKITLLFQCINRLLSALLWINILFVLS